MEDLPPMADQTSGTCAMSQGAESPAVHPPVHNISSSHEENKGRRVFTLEEPSTGAWDGGPSAEQNISALIARREASMDRVDAKVVEALDRVNDKVVALPGNIMAQMTCMEMRLRRRIEELFESMAGPAITTRKTKKSDPSATPQLDKRTNRKKTDHDDYMLQGLLLERTGDGGTPGKGRKRGRGDDHARGTDAKDVVKMGHVRRLFSQSNTGVNSGHTPGGEVLRIPRRIPVAFNPTRDMALDETDVAVIAYAWSIDQLRVFPGEVLVDHDFARGTREQLQCIAPGGLLTSEVITMVACMLTTEERSIPGGALRWWLPPLFSQYALQSNRDPREVAGYYKEAFMGHVDSLLKVFIPMFDSNPDHWYLLVIDMVRNELVYLDSMPSKERRMMRERQIRKASIFVEEMLDDKAFYWRADFRIPNVSAFPIVSPGNLPKQTNGVDCGVYVCRWMALAERWRKYDLGDVNDFARVRLLVDLIRKPYNGKNEVITGGGGNCILRRAGMEVPTKSTVNSDMEDPVKDA